LAILKDENKNKISIKGGRVDAQFCFSEEKSLFSSEIGILS